MANKNSLHTFIILAYQESQYLEPCLKSILNQTQKSQVIIATTTPNSYITHLAKKYHLTIIKGTHTNIGGDFDFALNCGKTPLITIAHQDDIYEIDYLKNIIDTFKKHQNSSIIFTDYYELRNNQKVYSNRLLKTKRFLLTPIRLKPSLKTTFAKRLVIKFGNSICCPTVTFVKNNCPTNIFTSSFQCNVDWHAWETLSRHKGSFTFISKPLVGHRISESSTTTKIISQGTRTKEDYALFQRFWPKPIAKLLTKLYQRSEKSNSLKSQ